MSRHQRDGEERAVEAKLIYVYEAGDSSVGLPSGWVLVGLSVKGRVLDLPADLPRIEMLPETEGWE
jgi:hypothetical protein